MQYYMMYSVTFIWWIFWNKDW